MPQIAFYVASVSVGVGASGVMLAWDRNNRGPAGADDPNAFGDIGLFTWIGITTGEHLVKVKTKAPIQIPAENCPNMPDGFPDHDYVTRFEIKPGGTAFSAIADLSLEIFEDSTRVYGVAPVGQTLKWEVADGSFGSTAVSFQDRLTLQAWEDPLEGWAQLFNSDLSAREIWQELMTPNQPLIWI
ncbi:hypothetical protein [Nannocystis punicea]|uniref:Uncharacterized protein n=1 Tax=Nannocystis punicea TaxID=2995304 RepID=A0ABY7H8U8_9BACT|nr:hypothetical protein [Nannocystis poenicansa]WAS95697.1 hypothetical protein O0S08_06000 [Nannocystis poenicansa]